MYDCVICVLKSNWSIAGFDKNDIASCILFLSTCPHVLMAFSSGALSPHTHCSAAAAVSLFLGGNGSDVVTESGWESGVSVSGGKTGVGESGGKFVSCGKSSMGVSGGKFVSGGQTGMSESGWDGQWSAGGDLNGGSSCVGDGSCWGSCDNCGCCDGVVSDSGVGVSAGLEEGLLVSGVGGDWADDRLGPVELLLLEDGLGHVLGVDDGGRLHGLDGGRGVDVGGLGHRDGPGGEDGVDLGVGVGLGGGVGKVAAQPVALNGGRVV